MVQGFFLVWAIFALVTALYFAFVLMSGGRYLRKLKDVHLEPRDDWPAVSIIVPARNEERDIQRGLQSLLALDYPNLEIIAVNDRSTDRTGAILDEAAKTEHRLRVEHIRALPAGWLGKNHALHSAAQSATGKYLLFTDADVIFGPSTLRLAIQHCEQHSVDHLASTMNVVVPGWLMKAFVLTFGMFFLAYFRPWQVSNPRSRAYVGIGAFNLLRAAVYHSCGGHSQIAMRPDDDVMLGKLVKIHGYRQDFLDGVDMMLVPWYGSMRELIRGLEKNQFSGVDYSVPMVVSSSLIALAAFVAPFIMVWFADDLARWLFAAAAVMLWMLAIASAFAARLPVVAGLAFPLAVLLFVFIQWRTMLLVLAQGGLQWRDTFYSLAELKANRLKWPDQIPQPASPATPPVTKTLN